jgi:CBS domain-containing protein
MRTQVHQFTSPVITLEPENTVHDALFLMQKNDVKRIVIVKNNSPIGIVSERDVGLFLEKDKTIRALDKIALDEIMSRSPVTIVIGQHDHVEQCAVRMVTFQISSIIVVDDEGKLVGITTKSDLVKNFSNLYTGVYKVKDYMNKKVITCRKSDSLPFALNMLNRNKISRLIVTDNAGKPIGVISYDTFLRNSEYFKLGKQDTREYLLPNASAKELKVGNLIADELLTIDSEDDLSKAAKLMTTYKVSGIPTVDKDGNLEGMISSTDIVLAYNEVETHFRLIKKDPHFS